MKRMYVPAMRGRTGEDRLSEEFGFADDRWRRTADMEEESGYPPVDICENEAAVIVRAELPGMDVDDMELSLAAGVLTIRGEKKYRQGEEAESCYWVERGYGVFRRRIRLPVAVDEDAVRARYEDGVLTLTLPKRKVGKSSRIEIKTG